MPLSNADRKTEHALLWLFGVSFLVHVAGCIVSVYFIENESKGTNLYAFYRMRTTGEKISPGNTFIQNLNTGYRATCATNPSWVKDLLVLRSSYDADLDLENIQQTWLPATYHLFGLPYANGYWMLFLVFFFSLPEPELVVVLDDVVVEEVLFCDGSSSLDWSSTKE